MYITVSDSKICGMQGMSFYNDVLLYVAPEIIKVWYHMRMLSLYNYTDIYSEI